MSKYQIFTDFDGTIALNDLGDSLFEKFAKSTWIEAVQEWKQGKITSKDCIIRECAVTKVTQNQLEIFSDEQKID